MLKRRPLVRAGYYGKSLAPSASLEPTQPKPGVSANKRLRERMLAESKRPVHIPPLSLCTDNAAMIAGAGYYHYIHNDFTPMDFDVLPTWPLS